MKWEQGMHVRVLGGDLIQSKYTINVILETRQRVCLALKGLRSKSVGWLTGFSNIVFLVNLFPCCTSYSGICIWIPHMRLIEEYFIRIRYRIPWSIWVFELEARTESLDGRWTLGGRDGWCGWNYGVHSPFFSAHTGSLGNGRCLLERGSN